MVTYSQPAIAAPPSDLSKRRPHTRGQSDSEPAELQQKDVSAPKDTAAQDTTAAYSTTTFLALAATFLPAFTLIFGGCCSNVYTLEALVSSSTSSGTLITLVQFLAVSIFTFPTQLTYSKSKSSTGFPRLQPQLLPVRTLLVYTGFFLAINVLNNLAFGYHISVPLHIILRSAGPVTTMIIGYCVAGRRYARSKVFGVLILFAGVVTAALADSQSKAQLPPPPSPRSEPRLESSPSTSGSPPSEPGHLRTQLAGLVLILLALLLASFQGLFTDSIYTTHGRSSSLTTQLLFYSHFISLPFFAIPPNHHAITQSLSELSDKSSRASSLLINDASATRLYQFLFACFHRDPSTPSPTTIFFSNSDIVHPAYDVLSLLSSAFSTIPTFWVTLFLNSVTQYLCISGVNRLSRLSSSLTVGIVLNVRKLTSLVLSIWFFGNDLSAGIVLGAGLVFLGGGLYAWPEASNSATLDEKRSTTNGTEKKLGQGAARGLGAPRLNSLGAEPNRETGLSEKELIWDLETKPRTTGNDIPHLFTDLDQTRGKRLLPGELYEGQFKRQQEGSL